MSRPLLLVGMESNMRKEREREREREREKERQSQFAAHVHALSQPCWVRSPLPRVTQLRRECGNTKEGNHPCCMLR